jgi:hypothetical protein
VTPASAWLAGVTGRWARNFFGDPTDEGEFVGTFP